MKMLGIGVYVNDGLTELPSDDIAYIICNDQVFLKKKFGLVEAIVPVQKIQLFNQKELEIKPTAKLNIPKITEKDFQNVFYFFRKIYERDKSEAIVRLYYDQEIKKIIIYCPDQQNIGMTVKAQIKSNDEINKYLHIGDIHSHCTMSGFHSGTDIHDEEKYSGLHLTIGYIDRDIFSIAASIVVNNVRVMVDPCDYVEELKTEGNNLFYFENKFNFDNNIITEWMTKVKKPEPINNRNKLFDFKSELWKRTSGWKQKEIQDYFEDSEHSVFKTKYHQDAFEWLNQDVPKICQYCKHNPNLNKDDIGSNNFELNEEYEFLETDIDEIIEEDDDGLIGYYDNNGLFISLDDDEIEEIKNYHRKQIKSKGEDLIHE